MSDPRPAILVDVDGVLNAMLACNKPRRTCPCHPGWIHVTARPEGMKYRLHLYPSMGPALLKMAADTGAELVWASTWENHANHWVGPEIGLPQLPFVPISFRPRSGFRFIASIGEWKARQVNQWAGGRPFVWFEDEPDAVDGLAALRAPDSPPALIVPVDERTGLTDDHLAQARMWLERLS